MLKQIAIKIIDWVVVHVPMIPRRITEFFARLLPLRETILLESKPDFADNTYAVYQELLKRGLNKKYQLIWVTHSDYSDMELPENVSFLNLCASWFSNNIRGRWIIARSNYIIDCNGYVHKKNRRTIRVHLTHGLPIKSVPWNNRAVGKVDLLCVCADYWVPICAESYGIAESIVQPLGYPRNDCLLHPVAHAQKALMWMPTYRVHAATAQSHTKESSIYQSIMPLGLPCIRDADALRELNELLVSYDAILYIRLHPAQDTSAIHLHDFSNIRICDNAYLQQRGMQLYDLLRETDALITDYSSIYFDYLLLDKPIAMVIADFAEYSENNGLLETTPESYAAAHPAVYVRTFEELQAFFRDVLEGRDTMREGRQTGRAKYMGAQTDHTAATVVDYLQAHFKL